MRHIKSISTNIKVPGGIKVDGLGPKVFVSGDNGSGKTALINAVQLALTGKASDLSGNRTGKSVSLLEGLRPDGEEMLYARVGLSDDSIAHWEMTAEGKVRHTKSPGMEEELCFPMDDAIDALKGSKETTLKFFCKYFLQPEDFSPLISSFNDDELAIHNSLLTQHSQQKGSCLPLLDAYESVSSSKRKHGAEVSALEKAALALGVDHVHGRSEIDQLFHKKIKSAKSYKAACAKVAGVYMGRIEDAFRSAQGRLENIISEQLGKRFSMQVEGNRISMGHAGKSGPIAHLSGAEWVELSCALAAAAAVRSTGRYNVILAPDRAMDRKTLRALMSGLRSVPANIFVQSPLQPWGRPLASWTKVELTEES